MSLRVAADANPSDGAMRWERWVTPPRQERARLTFERVLDAGAALLSEAGYEGFSMTEVCRRASVAPGTLYGRVEGKDELFLALHDRELERITHRGLAQLEEFWPRRLSTRRLVEEVVAFLCRHFSQEQALLRVFILRAAADPRVRDEGAHYVALLEEGVVALLATRSADFSRRDVDKAVRTAYSIVVDSLSWRTAFRADFHRHGDQTEADWQRRLIDVVLAYLFTPPAR